MSTAGRASTASAGLYNLCDRLRLIGITPGYDGGLAEYAALTGEVLRGGVVHRAPATMSHPQAALAEPLQLRARVPRPGRHQRWATPWS